MTIDTAAGIDIHKVRRDFPILKREVRPGVPLIYLDNAATSQRPRTRSSAESKSSTS